MIIANRFMQHYWRWSRGLTMGVQCCLIDPEGRILLVRHGYRPGWHFPGGGVEKGETLATALERELAEEVGVVLGKPATFVGAFANFKSFQNDHIILFASRDWTQTRQPVPNFEIAEIGRFPPDALPEQLHPPLRLRLQEILDDKSPSPHWQS